MPVVVGSWVQKIVWGIVIYLLRNVADEIGTMAWGWFSTFYSAPVAVLSDPLVQRLTQLAVGLVLGLLPVALAAMVLKEMALRMDGTSVTPPEALIRRGMVAGVAVTATSLVAWFMITLAEQAREVLGAVGFDINPLIRYFNAPNELLFTVWVLNLLFVVGAAVLLVQRLIVSAEFTVLLIIGPIMAAGLLREDGASTWQIWLREATSLLITPLLQLLVTLLFVQKWGGGAAPPDIGERLMALALLYVLWNTPRWARQMVYSAGAGGAVVGTAAEVGRMVAMRQMMKAAAAAAA